MYLIIFEDGEIRSATEINDDDLDSCEAGYLDIIHIWGNDVLQWTSHGWEKVRQI